MTAATRGALLYSLVPEHGRGAHAERLREQLVELGESVSLRSIQRDLAAMARVGLLRSDGERPACWWRA